MIATPQSICTRALKLINAIGQTDTPTAEDMQDAYQSLLEMVDGWRVDRLAILVVKREEFDLNSGQRRYTIGPGGDFDVARPTWIDRASIITNVDTDNPLELPIDVFTVGQWQRVPIKAVRSSLPTALYYDHAYDAPGGLGNIDYYPVPNVSNIQTVLYLPTPIAQFTSITESYDFPPAYLRALRFNLAVDCAPEFDIVPTPQVVELAARYLADVRRANIQPELLIVDRALIRRRDIFNFYTGEPL